MPVQDLLKHSIVNAGLIFFALTILSTLISDPMFVDTANGDFRLQPGSPCIDAGDNTAVPPGLTTDVDGNPRFADDLATTDTGNGECPVVDMGSTRRAFGMRRAMSRPV